MSQYAKTAEEIKLLALPFDTSTLTLLQSRSISRIQLISFKGIKALKSIQDANRKLRIVLAALLTKIFLRYTPENNGRLTAIKRMVYNSRQESITEQRGILRQNILKMVAQQLTKLQIGSEVQLQIVKIFNNVPFFDQVLINAVKQQNPLVCQNDCEMTGWLDRELDIKISVSEDPLIEETDGQMLLVGLGQQFHASKDCKSSDCTFKDFRQFVRYSSHISTEVEQQQMHKVYDRKTRGQMFSRLIFEQEHMDEPIKQINPNLYDTVLSSSVSVDLANSRNNSPMPNIKPKRDKQFKSAGLFDSSGSHIINMKKQDSKTAMKPSETYDKEKEKQEDFAQSQEFGEDDKKIIKVRRAKQQNREEGGIWSILCCNF